MTQRSGLADTRFLLCSAAVLVVVAASGCGSKKGVTDLARVDACVLTGATTNDGCDATIALGDLTMGAVKTRDVALYNGGAGAVPASLSAVTLDGATGNYAILKLFKLNGSAQEVDVTLPYDLAVGHGSELRVRVAFTANVAVGPVTGTALRVTASHPSTAVVLPVIGQVTGCPAGRGDCDGDPSNGCEVDLQASLEHCGACGTVAAPTSCGAINATAACVNGTCEIGCAAGFGNCDGNAANGCETDLLTDASHCSACGTACDASNGTASCTAGACGISCHLGFADCDGDPSNGCEVDLGSDAGHCGACGTVCGSVNGTGTCSTGACVTSCDPGFASCDGQAANGCEVNLQTDLGHCGACGTTCGSNHATPACSAGACQLTCATGFADCDGNPANGCEVDLSADPANCGRCGGACNATNGTATCAGSVCGITCATGFGNCDGSAANGCEVDLNTSPANCGRCGGACDATNGTATCSAGACGITCAAGFGNCDGNAANGCEINLTTSLGHCGTCGAACGTANAAPACTAGTCSLACSPGYADCNGVNADGCEVNLVLDPANCGGCNLACVTPNATPGCAAGACTVAACSANHADCNVSAADGCEVDMATDPNNCGGCGNVCNATNGTASCVSGLCQVACNPGFADCDNNPANGCEVNLDADPANCGTCGKICGGANATGTCGAGACGLACNPGWADCNANLADGCEIHTAVDVSNCGACGNACVAGSHVATVACGASACRITSCAAGAFDIDGVFSDGCECLDDGGPQTCSAASAVTLTVPPGGTASRTSNVLPRFGSPRWVQVNFTGVGGTATYYHPLIAFLSNPGGAYKLRVYGACDGTSANGCTGYLDAFEMSFPSNPNGCNYYGNCWDPTPRPTTIYVSVEQVASVPSTSCGGFTIQASNI